MVDTSCWEETPFMSGGGKNYKRGYHVSEWMSDNNWFWYLARSVRTINLIYMYKNNVVFRKENSVFCFVHLNIS